MTIRTRPRPSSPASCGRGSARRSPTSWGRSRSWVRRCLDSRDPDVRAQAIEALESLGDPRLARRVTTLLDEDPSRPSPVSDRDMALARLAHDDDAWLRRLAEACLGDG